MNDSHREVGIEFTACQNAGLPVRPTLLPLYPISDDHVGQPAEVGAPPSISASAGLAAALSTG